MKSQSICQVQIAATCHKNCLLDLWSKMEIHSPATKERLAISVRTCTDAKRYAKVIHSKIILHDTTKRSILKYLKRYKVCTVPAFSYQTLGSDL